MTRRQRIAIVGSGIGGLAACWLLGSEHHVTLLERLPSPGMGAHAYELDSGVSVDVPLRVFHAGYYPNLVELYAGAGIPTVSADYRGCFTDDARGTQFSYRTLRLAGRSLPLVTGRTPPGMWRDLLRFYVNAPRDLRTSKLHGQTVRDYCRAENYSDGFVRGLLLPAFASICTCTYEQVLEAPAIPIVDYLARGRCLSQAERADGGAGVVVERLTAAAATVRCGVSVTSIRPVEDAVRVRSASGREEEFDHVVVATQANQAISLLAAATAREVEALGAFSYQPSRVVVHRDRSLAPPSPRRASVNLFVAAEHPAPMATIWMNAVQQELAHDPTPLFQTWNPLREPRPEQVLVQREFERPIVNDTSMCGVARLRELLREPDRRIWFCGSYAEAGIPLLESAVTSAMEVAAAISNRSAAHR